MGLYFLDSNVLIEAKNGPYGFDIAKPFWNWLEEQFLKKTVILSKLVYDELVDGNDELSDWIKQFSHSGAVIVPNKDTQNAYQKIADYVIQNYPNHHVNSFLSRADAWVIAHASVDNATVVTHEALVDSASKKIKIPNICKYFNVDYDNLYKMMRNLGFSFASLSEPNR